jgi:3-hydroxyacyl-CoA dehydrogenase/enoyl-CoA hydratase/3-hydroxybutyryl-CoA epimerase
MRHLSLNIAGDGIATLTLDNADEAANLVSQSWLAEMETAIAAVSTNPSVKGVIITSGKPMFMAGADLKMLVEACDTLDAEEAFQFSQRATRMHRAIERSGKPWAAALNGITLGGGFELALACHRRFLADDVRALVGLPEVNVGLLPGSGGTQRLLRVAGLAAAADLLLSGRSLSPAEALSMTVVDEIAPRNALEAHARAWLETEPTPTKPWDEKGYRAPGWNGLLDPTSAALFSMASASIAARGGHNAPAGQAILSCIFEGAQLPFDKALAVESKYFAKLLTGPVSRNIIRTTFVSKAAAEKGARRPAGIPGARLEKIGIIGAGMMGSGIALVSALAGLDVVLIDQDLAAAQKGKAYSAKVLARQTEKGQRMQTQADDVLARIVPAEKFASLEGCGLVIEAVFEDTQVKADATRRAEAVMPASAIFATNTSTLPISGLAQASQRPGQFIGLHFFSPVDRMNLVEIIMGRETSSETLARSIDFIAQIRKTPIVVNDSRGFYTSRVFQTFIHEGAAMVAEGIPPAAIENAAKQAGFPVGPLALLDEVSLDLPLKIIDQAVAEEGSAYIRPAGAPVLRRLRDELGRAGRKSGAGFYDYPDGSKKRLWSGLASIYPAFKTYDFDDLKARFLYIQAIETARCIEEGVLATPQDADLGAVYGWGFPTWTGGTASYIDTIGMQAFVREADRLAQHYGERFAPSAWLRAKADRHEAFYPGLAGSAERAQQCAG